MSYNFGRRKAAESEEGREGLNLKGLARGPVVVDPAREERAIQRGAALGFVDREERIPEKVSAPAGRRARPKVPQSNLFIKGPKEVLDWFAELSVERGHKAYWQTLQELREAFERDQAR